MTTATKNLENDHEHILQLTDIMLAMTKKQSADVGHVELALDLVREYADKFHHAKEEDLLFPLLGEKGFPVKNGPVGVMLAEHEEGRNFIKGAAEAIQSYKPGNKEALTTVFRNLSGFALLLQNHIYKENNILFKMADEALNPAEQERLLKQFNLAESQAETEFNAENAIKKIESLATIYL
ncbi:hemerythrin domain-containing protein [Prolixibacteraceae bacterium Z1-6]|uniref:Hemerythrin domain-containing protein n=1 Tax=Draconibacterium aestuarii TaxID=2998507 RepID=A0A9X3F9E5_9BACT|nr:hemerythrin domain-containing protein [Prolixibacteraceae bacterium Z1-6]